MKIVDAFQKQLGLISLIKEFNVKGNTLTVEQKIEQEIKDYNSDSQQN